MKSLTGYSIKRTICGVLLANAVIQFLRMLFDDSAEFKQHFLGTLLCLFLGLLVLGTIKPTSK